MKSLNGDLFAFNAYWKRWSRVLRRSSRKATPNVEVDVSPANWDDGRELGRIKAINIRAYTFWNDGRWTYHTEIPDHIVDSLEGLFGKDIVKQLLHDDLFPLLDLERYTQVANNGAPFALLRQAPVASIS